MSAIKMMAKEVKPQLISQMQNDLDIMKQHHVVPTLAIILVGDDAASQIYVRNKAKLADKLGISQQTIILPKESTTLDVIMKVTELNEDPNVDAILVQLPLPSQIDTQKVLDTIDITKDVDGFSPQNIGKLFLNQNTGLIEPNTPLGITKILDHYHYSVDGKNVLVIGRSHIVGKPMAAMMLNRNATVTIAHSHTKNLKELCLNADIIISATNLPQFITADMIKKGAILIDVGIIRLAPHKLVGNFNIDDDMLNKAAAYTPVPGGVGPMTVTMLIWQTTRLAKRHHIDELQSEISNFKMEY